MFPPRNSLFVVFSGIKWEHGPENGFKSGEINCVLYGETITLPGWKKYVVIFSIDIFGFSWRLRLLTL